MYSSVQTYIGDNHALSSVSVLTNGGSATASSTSRSWDTVTILPVSGQRIGEQIESTVHFSLDGFLSANANAGATVNASFNYTLIYGGASATANDTVVANNYRSVNLPISLTYIYTVGQPLTMDVTLNTAAAVNCNGIIWASGNAVSDFSSTLRITRIDIPDGFTLSSESGTIYPVYFVPEPSTYSTLLLGVGFAGLVWKHRKRI